MDSTMSLAQEMNLSRRQQCRRKGESPPPIQRLFLNLVVFLVFVVACVSARPNKPHQEPRDAAQVTKPGICDSLKLRFSAN